MSLKLELLHHTGSFKPRGAFNRVLSAGVPAVGLVAASGGNHGLAVAHVARELGVQAEVFVPTSSSAVKVSRLRRYGAQVTVIGDFYADADAASEQRAAETGALVVHAYDQPEVVAGQGTVGAELDRQLPGVDTVLVAVGGGGLLGGIAADSLGARRIGEVGLWAAQDARVQSVLVSDQAIVAARQRLWDELRVAAEAGGATALAALTCGAYRPVPGERVAVVVCGGNTDSADLVEA